MRARRPGSGPDDDDSLEDEEEEEPAMDDMHGNSRLLARLDERVRDHERRLRRAEETFVSHSQFGPVEKLVYGLAAAMLIAVVGALLKVVIIS